MKKKLLFLSILISVCILMIGFQGSWAQQDGYAGTEVCKGCHEKYFTSYSKSIHGKKAISGTPVNREGCESCHGPGAAHAEKGGGKGTIFAFGKREQAEEKSSRCLRCHTETKEVAFWDLGRHKTMRVSCDNCHGGHSSKTKQLKTPEPELCFGCHTAIKVKTNKMSHHPIREGKIKCGHCHNPHGSFVTIAESRRRSHVVQSLRADSINELCYKCHADKRGPFMWEHPPVEENCMVCHEVHGSNHLRLLTSKVPYLCQACHNDAGHPSSIYTRFETFNGTATSGKNRMFARSCLNCHANIHGSNGPSARGKAFVR